METDHREMPLRLKQPPGLGERLLQFVELSINKDPDRLEGSRCRRRRCESPRLLGTVFATRSARCRVVVIGFSFRSSAIALAMRRASSRLAVPVDHPGDLGLRGSCEPLRRVFPRARIHPHIKRTVEPEREPALRVIDLRRRNTDIHQHAAHASVTKTEFGKPVTELENGAWIIRNRGSVIARDASIASGSRSKAISLPSGAS